MSRAGGLKNRVCVCARGRSAAAPARSPAPPSPECAAIVSPSAPGLSLAAGRGAETRVPCSAASSSCPKSGRGHQSEAESGFGSLAAGRASGAAGGEGSGGGRVPPELWMKPPGLGSYRGRSDRSTTRCIVSSGVSRFLSYAFACGRWWWGLFLFLCSGRRDPPLFPAGNL